MSGPIHNSAVEPPATGGSDREQVTLLGLASIPLRHPRLVTGLPVALGLLTALVVLLWGASTFTASSAFLPHSAQSGSRMTGLAAQFGVNLQASDQGQSPEFYAHLVSSPGLLREAVMSQYEVEIPGAEAEEVRRGNLIDFYEPEGETARQRLRRAIGELRDNLTSGTDLASGLVTIRVTAPWPELAVQINERLLELVNHFNIESRQTQAAQERAFVERRLDSAQASLRRVESELRNFLESNRGYESSPQLSFEAQRLQRNLDLQQQIYTDLAQSYEQARIEEVRNTPVITVVDWPDDMVTADGPSVVRLSVMASIVGFFLAFGIAFGLETFRKQKADYPKDYEDFAQLREEAMRSLVPSALRSSRSKKPRDGKAGPDNGVGSTAGTDQERSKRS